MTFRPIDTGNTELNREINFMLAMADDTEPGWWWLSFCDTDRPKGTQFLGACLVKASNVPMACRRAWDLGINPGGQVASAGPLTDEQLPSTYPVDVLMSKDDIERYDAA